VRAAASHAEVRAAVSPFIRQQRQAMISFIAKEFIGQPRDECPDNNQIDQNDPNGLLLGAACFHRGLLAQERRPDSFSTVASNTQPDAAG
jgi:hypothetical protein